MKPLIGLPGRRKKGSEIAGNLEVLTDSDIDIYYADYARGVVDAGGIPVHLPLDVDPADLVDRLDGVLLTGGCDIEPARYGQEVAGAVDTNAQRDEYELALLDGAIALDLPTIGICRGLQVVNVHAGGTLIQDVPEHAVLDQPVDKLTHDVVFELGTRIGELYGERQSVNSLHHQAIDEVGDGLVVAGRAADGGIEAIESTSKPILAVQWHPEMLSTRPGDPLFSWLIEKATARASA